MDSGAGRRVGFRNDGNAERDELVAVLVAWQQPSCKIHTQIPGTTSIVVRFPRNGKKSTPPAWKTASCDHI